MICKDCKCPIVKHMKYYKHTDGTILCKDCFDAIVNNMDKVEYIQKQFCENIFGWVYGSS